MIGSDILMSLGHEPTDMYPDPKLIVLALGARDLPPDTTPRHEKSGWKKRQSRGVITQHLHVQHWRRLAAARRARLATVR